MAYTLHLTDRWDVTVDDAGRIRMAEDAYAVAQNVANACRLFTGDAYFNQEDGIPHFINELGSRPNESVLVSRLNTAARRVPGVASASARVTDFSGRTLSGDILITTTTGETLHVDL